MLQAWKSENCWRWRLAMIIPSTWRSLSVDPARKNSPTWSHPPSMPDSWDAFVRMISCAQLYRLSLIYTVFNGPFLYSLPRRRGPDIRHVDVAVPGTIWLPLVLIDYRHFPNESHATNHLISSLQGEPKRCECGQWYKLVEKAPV